MSLVTVYSKKDAEPFEVRPHHAKHLISLGWTIDPPVTDTAPATVHEITEVVEPEQHD
jgi:hypothetical protein